MAFSELALGRLVARVTSRLGSDPPGGKISEMITSTAQELERLGVDARQAKRLIWRYPALLNWKHRIEPTVDILERRCFAVTRKRPRGPALRALLRTPRMVMFTEEDVVDRIEELRRLGVVVEENDVDFIGFHHSDLLLRTQKLHRVVEALMRRPLNLRVKGGGVGIVLKAQGTALMRGSPEELTRKGEFYVGEMGMSLPYDVVRHPLLLARSLLGWIGPRHAILWKLQESVSPDLFARADDETFCKHALRGAVTVTQFREFRLQWIETDGKKWMPPT